LINRNRQYQVLMIFIFGSLFACQNIEQSANLETEADPLSRNTPGDDVISAENDRLDLSLDTLEQQIKDKAEAAAKLESARKQRIIIKMEKPSHSADTINIAAFARSTINKKGESVYTRSPFQTFDHWTECAFFNTNENAQRFFLKTGGPKVDLKNLDPDGDGFACAWDPSIYRQLAIPADK
jgi:hypothetical protein